MSHVPSLIIDLALILGAAAVITLLFKKLRQPMVLGYIIAGLLVGPYVNLFPTVVETESIRTWADIGVIFLLFGLGLEFSFKKLVKLGGVAVVTAVTGVVCTMLLGFAVGKLLNWNHIDAIFLGGILAIASTTIIIRAFRELGVRTQKFTDIVLGVLVVEDLVAVVLMVVLSTMALTRSFAGGEMVVSVLKLVFFLVLWFVSGIFFLPTILKNLKNLLNEESLLIFSLSLCFLMVWLASAAGFSSALGAFVMGSILAETTKAERIEHLMKSLKDLFGAIFFVSVGMLIDPAMLVAYAVPIIAGTLVLLLGKPLFVTAGAMITGQPIAIAVRTGMSLSQIGEFSFIIATLGTSLKVTSDFLYPVAVAISVLTTFTTPYMIKLSAPMYRFFEDILPRSWRGTLDSYTVGTSTIKDESAWKRLLRSYLINSIVFSVIIVTVILVGTTYILPSVVHLRGSRIITTAITLLIISPFLWALAFRRSRSEDYTQIWMKPIQRGPLILLMIIRMLLAIFYVGLLFDRLFSPFIAFAGVLITCLILVLLRKQIKRFYGKIELQFLSNLNEREKKEAKNVLTPWDTHLTVLEMHPHSPYIGKTLEATRIREEFGVNIAIIGRGNTIINVPGRDEFLYPYDKLSVIGTDEQLRNFKNHLESSIQETAESGVKYKVSLNNFVLKEGSSLAGKNIRQSGIREKAHGLVVGVERDGKRILNPESDFVFRAHDKVWIVGNEKRIHVLTK